MAFQRGQLRKGYRTKRSKITIKVMRQVRNQHTKATNQIDTKHVDIRPNEQGLKHLLGFDIPQFDTTMGFVNRVDSPILLKQCMNSLQPAKHKLSPVKTSPQANLTKRTRHAFSPITILGTPETSIELHRKRKETKISTKGGAYNIPRHVT
jgi:hypothetical protein